MGNRRRSIGCGQSADPAAASTAPQGSRVPVPALALRPTSCAPRRRKRVRLRYLMQAWGVSLVVHVVILSALAAATFTSPDTIKKIINFDSALASYSNGEPEVLPIYADPDNIPRDRAIGDEHATTPGEAAPVVLS